MKQYGPAQYILIIKNEYSKPAKKKQPEYQYYFFYNREINHIHKFKYADNYLTKTVVFRHLKTELLFEYALTFHQGEKFWLHNAILRQERKFGAI